MSENKEVKKIVKELKKIRAIEELEDYIETLELNYNLMPKKRLGKFTLTQEMYEEICNVFMYIKDKTKDFFNIEKKEIQNWLIKFLSNNSDFKLKNAFFSTDGVSVSFYYKEKYLCSLENDISIYYIDEKIPSFTEDSINIWLRNDKIKCDFVIGKEYTYDKKKNIVQQGE